MSRVVLDTGHFLLASRMGSQRPSKFLLEMSIGSRRAALKLFMSLFAWMECASHVLHAEPSWPRGTWEHSGELQFLRTYPSAVEIDRPQAGELIEAVHTLRALGNGNPERRRGPSFVDAMTAQLVRRLDANVLVTDDRSDFGRLLPDFHGELWTPRQLIDVLGK